MGTSPTRITCAPPTGPEPVGASVLSASAVAAGSEPAPESSIGARIGGAISDRGSDRRLPVVGGRERDRGRMGPGPPTGTPRARRRPRRRRGRRRRRESCSWSPARGSRASGPPAGFSTPIPTGPVARGGAGSSSVVPPQPASARREPGDRGQRADEGGGFSACIAAGGRYRGRPAGSGVRFARQVEYPTGTATADSPRVNGYDSSPEDSVYFRRLIRGALTAAERGNHFPGGESRGESAGGEALSALARQLTPQARRKRDDLRTTRFNHSTLGGVRARRRAHGLAAAGGNGTGRPTSQATTNVQPAGGAGGLAQPPHPEHHVSSRSLPGDVAKIIKGVAYAPANAPIQVKKAIWAGNQIRTKPYIYGGGHGRFIAPVTTAPARCPTSCTPPGCSRRRWTPASLRAGASAASGSGSRSIPTQATHSLRSPASGSIPRGGRSTPAPGTGPRWRPVMTGTGGYVARHPTEL